MLSIMQIIWKFLAPKTFIRPLDPHFSNSLIILKEDTKQIICFVLNINY